ncbi:PAS domain-containing protein, partial [Vibrio campbellii]
LEESEDKFNKISNLIPEGLLIVEDDHIISANDAAASLLGFSSHSELLGEELSRLFVDQKTKAVFNQKLEHILTKAPLVCLSGPRCNLERKIRLYSDKLHILGSPSHIVIMQDAEQSEK